MRFILSLCAFVLFHSCTNKVEDIYALHYSEAPPEELATGVDVLYSDSSILQVRITGPVMKRIQDNGQVKEEFPEGMQVEFYDKNGIVESWLDAKYGVRNPLDNEVVVRDSVVMKNTRGELLRTSELKWNEKDGNVYTNKYIQYSSPDEIIKGFGFRADANFTRFEINAVTGRIKLGDIEADFQ